MPSPEKLTEEPMVPEENIEGVPETEEAGTEESQEKIRIKGILTDPNFEGSLIVNTENAEGRMIGYAIRKNKEGGLEGNQINYMSDGSIGATQQLHEADFAKLEKQGVLATYEQALEEEKSKGLAEAKFAIQNIFLVSENFNPAFNTYPETNLMNSAQESLNNLSPEEQEQVATKFFDDTIGRDISNNTNAYKVYMLFKGTSFAEKFAQLEDERLKEAGYRGFTL